MLPVSRFITFEGIEGSGKSSHARSLAAALRARGYEVVETREPGGTPAGTAIRALLLGAEATPLTALAELFLYCADRTQHVTETIRPALDAGHVVVCDRFSDSTIAYQGYGRGLDLDIVQALDARAREGLEPSLTFLLDCPAEVGLARAKARAGAADRFERETVAFHARVRTGFTTLATQSPGRMIIVDSTQDPAVTGKRIVEVTLERLEAQR